MTGTPLISWNSRPPTVTGSMPAVGTAAAKRSRMVGVLVEEQHVRAVPIGQLVELRARQDLEADELGSIEDGDPAVLFELARRLHLDRHGPQSGAGQPVVDPFAIHPEWMSSMSSSSGIVISNVALRVSTSTRVTRPGAMASSPTISSSHGQVRWSRMPAHRAVRGRRRAAAASMSPT